MTDWVWAHVAKALEILSPVLIAALSWLSVQVARFINARVQNERVRTMLQRLDDAVFVAVREVEQVLVSSLKNGASDGLWTAEDRQRAKDAALAVVRSYLGPKGFVELGKVLGVSELELQRIIGARIEAAVYDLRATPSHVFGQVFGKLSTLAANGALEPKGS